jgi:hypothetical protein
MHQRTPFTMLFLACCCVIYLCRKQGSQDRVGLLQQKRMEKLEAERVSMQCRELVALIDFAAGTGSKYWQH